MYLPQIEKLSGRFDEFTDELWLGLADHMVIKRESVTVVFRDGTEKEIAL